MSRRGRRKMRELRKMGFLANVTNPPNTPSTPKVPITPRAYTTYKACVHERDPILVGEHLLLASEYYRGFDINTEPIPGLGIYLYDSWAIHFTKPQIFGKLPIPATDLEPPFPAVIIECPDMGALPRKTMDWLLALALATFKQNKSVEVGCFAGHGRTGMVLACILGTVEGLNAKNAIIQIRKRYCSKAIESKDQINFIADFLGTPRELVKDLNTKFTYGYQPPIGGGFGD